MHATSNALPGALASLASALREDDANLLAVVLHLVVGEHTHVAGEETAYGLRMKTRTQGKMAAKDDA